MFGYVSANWKELTPEQQDRYGAVYCGVCRRIREQSGNLSRLSLSYDIAFLSILLMSLYEPEETVTPNACILHPLKKRPWVDSGCIRYGADMNVALAYYNALDDYRDDGRLSARLLSSAFGKHYPQIQAAYPRQCQAIEDCITRLGEMEKANCPNPDEPANCFGTMMGELLVWQEDLWSPILRQMGMGLGRFIYLLDAALDYDGDKRKGRYNPYIAMNSEKNWQNWEEYLVLAMAKCTQAYEKLPLVQDKGLLDNILYSGVWVSHSRGKEEEKDDD